MTYQEIAQELAKAGPNNNVLISGLIEEAKKAVADKVADEMTDKNAILFDGKNREQLIDALLYRDMDLSSDYGSVSELLRTGFQGYNNIPNDDLIQMYKELLGWD